MKDNELVVGDWNFIPLIVAVPITLTFSVGIGIINMYVKNEDVVLLK